jgi:hypothetical protein
MFNLRCRINGEGCGGGSKGGAPGAETAIWTKFRLECEEYPFSTSYLSPDCPMFNLRCRINGEGCGGGSKGNERFHGSALVYLDFNRQMV